MSKKITTSDFVERARQTHGDMYDYSQVIYVNAITDVRIVCKEHGEFSQQPTLHYKGTGCEECRIAAVSFTKKLRYEKEFLVRARRKYSNKYDYSKLDYEHSDKKVVITCPTHGDFSVTPSNFLRPKNYTECIFCSRQERFIRKAMLVHGKKYDYSDVEYRDQKTNIDIICSKHGVFSQMPDNHVNNRAGCRECFNEKMAKAQTKSLTQFIKEANKIHGGKYDYSQVDYKKSIEKVIIICPIHGGFEQSPNSHVSHMAGCKQCINKSEGQLIEFLNDRNIELQKNFRVLIQGSSIRQYREFDVFLPGLNLLIEYDGHQHYPKTYTIKNPLFGTMKDYKSQHQNDIYKTRLAKRKGYQIARIPYWLNKQELEIELENILSGKPTYPDVPKASQEKKKPKPNKIAGK
jgi:hypothetical protein